MSDSTAIQPLQAHPQADQAGGERTRHKVQRDNVGWGKNPTCLTDAEISAGVTARCASPAGRRVLRVNAGVIRQIDAILARRLTPQVATPRDPRGRAFICRAGPRCMGGRAPGAALTRLAALGNSKPAGESCSECTPSDAPVCPAYYRLRLGRRPPAARTTPIGPNRQRAPPGSRQLVQASSGQDSDSGMLWLRGSHPGPSGGITRVRRLVSSARAIRAISARLAGI